MSKSILLGINTDEVLLQELAESTGCELGDWPIKYLGLPLGGNPPRIEFWDPVVSKVAKRLDGWKKAFLSRGGRLTLIQSVLQALPTYYLSLFKAPIGVLHSIEKIMRDFLWDGGDMVGGEHLVDWEVVCCAKDRGGLGIGNLGKRNKALLMKWLGRFPKEERSLWHKVIKSNFGLKPNLWDTKEDYKGTFRSPWKAISSLYTEFHQMVVFKVGNGNKIRFWEDVWVGENSLQALFPSLFRLSSLKSRPISEFFVQSSLSLGDNRSWNLHFTRNLLDREIY